MERPSKCCYPDCFHCPYDDCMTDIYTEEECISDKQLGVSYYSRNREKILEKAKQKRREHGEEVRAKARDYYARMPEEKKEHKLSKHREYYRNNYEKIMKQKAEYREKNREQINAKMRERRKLKKEN